MLYISTDKDIIQECQNIQQSNSFIFIIIDEEYYSEIALYQLLYSILQAVRTENINQTAAIGKYKWIKKKSLESLVY